MEITVLGTGTSQGVPVVACKCEVCKSSDPCDKRLRTSVMIKTDRNTFVIDAGPDFRQQMLRENVRSVDAILITHNHKDHTGGIDDVRAFNWVLQKPMEIYAAQNVIDTIKSDFAYAFQEQKYPGVPQINLHEIKNQPFAVHGEHLIPIAAMHASMPVFGFRIGSFSYLTDASSISHEELEKMKGSKLLILNALRKEDHHSHFTLDEAVDIIRYLKPEQAFLTHISHQMGFHRAVNAELPEGIALAYDGLKITI